jgi:hypothetical protein
MYNDTDKNNTIDTLANAWAEHENKWLANQNMEIIILGDFNCHHSTWEARTNSHLTSLDRLLNPLLDLIVNMHLEMALPWNIPTLEAHNTHNWTCPDNVWRCTNNPSPFISCDINPSLCPTHTDHLPIVSIIDIAYMPSNQPKIFNYKTIDWSEYKSKLETNLSGNNALTLNPITTTDKLECVTDMIFRAIDKTTREVASKIKLSHTQRDGGQKN